MNCVVRTKKNAIVAAGWTQPIMRKLLKSKNVSHISGCGSNSPASGKSVTWNRFPIRLRFLGKNILSSSWHESLLPSRLFALSCRVTILFSVISYMVTMGNRERLTGKLRKKIVNGLRRKKEKGCSCTSYVTLDPSLISSRGYYREMVFFQKIVRICTSAPRRFRQRR